MTDHFDNNAAEQGLLALLRSVLRRRFGRSSALDDASTGQSISGAAVRSILDAFADAVFIHKNSGPFLEVNQAACERLGYARDELLRMGPADIDSDDSAALVPDRIDALRTAGQGVFETVHVCRDGRTVPTELNATAIPLDGDLLVVTVARDITLRKQRESELRRTHQRITDILESISDGFFSVDEELRITYLNHTAEQLLGRNAEDVLGKKLFDAFPEARGSVFEQKYRQALREKKPLVFEAYFGATPYANWYDVRVYPFLGGISVYFQVTTERKQAEQRLRWDAEVNAALSALTGPLISPDSSIDDIAHAVRTQAMNVTESPEGCVSVIDRGSGANLPASATGLFEATWQAQPIKGPPGAGPSYAGFWGHTLNSGQELMTNSPASLRTLVDVPALPDAVRRCLSVPVKLGSEVIGQIALANSNREYTQDDLQTVRRIAEFYALAVQRFRSEDALRRSEEAHRQLFDEAPVAYHVLDTEGCIVRANQAELDLLGATQDDLLGKPIWLFAEDPDEMRAAVHAKLSGRREPEQSYLRTFRRLDGETVTVLVQDRLLRDEQGRILGIRSTLQDVTERQRMEARLEHLNAVLRAIRNVTQFITQTKDRKTLIGGTCEHLIETRGYLSAWIALFNDANELIELAHAGRDSSFQGFAEQVRKGSLPACLRQGLSMPGLVVIDDPSTFCEHCPMECGERQSGAMGTRLAHQDKVFGFLAVSLPAELAGDAEEQDLFEELAGDVAFALHDLAVREQRDRAERALRENERRFQEVLHHSKDVLYKQDIRRGTYDYISDAVEEILGFTPDEIKQMGATGIQKLLHPEDQKQIAAYREELLRTSDTSHPSDRPRSVEYRMRAKDGSYFWFHDSHVVLYDQDGRPLHLIGSARDVTDQKLAEQERRLFEEQLRHAQKLESLGVLAGGIAHDFNNLLVGILGNVSLALMDLPDLPEIRSSLEQAETAAQRAADLTNQLLAYSGKGRFVIEPVDVSSLVLEMSHLLSTAVSKRVSLVRDLAEDLPKIEGDMTQLRQVIMNLITNASEAIGDEPGTITVRTELAHADAEHPIEDQMGGPLPDGDYVHLTVTDTGGGMDEATIARMFDPFYTTKFTGRGLGLSAVLGIVRGHRGAVNVASSPGSGTRFEVFLPVHETPVTGATSTPQTPSKQEDAKMILIIDDEKSVLTVTSQMLQRAGYETLSADTSQEGIELFRGHSNDIGLVMLDVMMPGTKADQVLEELAHIQPDVRVMLLSGYSEDEATEEIAPEHIRGFLQKPYSAKTLLDAVEDAMGA